MEKENLIDLPDGINKLSKKDLKISSYVLKAIAEEEYPTDYDFSSVIMNCACKTLTNDEYDKLYLSSTEDSDGKLKHFLVREEFLK